jgi:tripartite-type tricarboxylate transporter receptor subunit TctC
MNRSLIFLLALTQSLAAEAGVSRASAQSVAEFYRGKTIEFLVAGAAAGASDLAARTVAKHMSGHIPGHPTIIIRNMPGATGLIMTNYLYNVAPRDGTAMGMPLSNELLEPRLKLLSADGRAVKFDVGAMNWIGTPTQEPQVTWVWHTAPAKTFEDLKTHTILMGATGASADNSILPLLVNELLGTRMQVVTGYIGQNAINIAVERGEVQGNNTGLSNLTVLRPDWVSENKVRILLQYGTKRLPELKEVPTVIELANSDAERAMLQFYALKFTLARPMALPPGVPADRVEALQAAFVDTMKDETYVEDARQIGLDVNWLDGKEMGEQIRQIEDTPQSVVDRLRIFLAHM